MHSVRPQRIAAGAGWLALIGGGEFSFGETEAADAAWIAKLDSVPVPKGASVAPVAADVADGPEAVEEPQESIPDELRDEQQAEQRELRPVGFLPTASGSQDYADHFQVYLDEYFERSLELIPVYRSRDARRGRNADRVRDEMAAVYLGGGLPEQLLDVLRDSPVEAALRERLEQGGIVAAIATAAQALGTWTRGLRGGMLPGLGWLPGGVVETNFEPGHERRLRQLMERPGVRWGLALTPGSAVLLGPGDGDDPAVEVVGTVYGLDAADGQLQKLGCTS